MVPYTKSMNNLDLDLSAFDVDEKEKEKKIKESEKRKKRFQNPNISISKKGNWFMFIVLAGIVFGFFFIFNHEKIELDKINEKNVLAKERLNIAKEKNSYLKTSLESLATMERVEAYASENGLMKEQTGQTIHINVNTEKSVEISPKKEYNAFEKAKSWFLDKLK